MYVTKIIFIKKKQEKDSLLKWQHKNKLFKCLSNHENVNEYLNKMFLNYPKYKVLLIVLTEI